MFKFRTTDNNLILKNISYLSFLRLINIVVKFLLVAYLVRILAESIMDSSPGLRQSFSF